MELSDDPEKLRHPRHPNSYFNEIVCAYNFSLYLTDNTIHPHYIDQPVNAFREITAVLFS
jgi:hypothetical protein